MFCEIFGECVCRFFETGIFNRDCFIDIDIIYHPINGSKSTDHNATSIIMPNQRSHVHNIFHKSYLHLYISPSRVTIYLDICEFTYAHIAILAHICFCACLCRVFKHWLGMIGNHWLIYFKMLIHETLLRFISCHGETHQFMPCSILFSTTNPPQPKRTWSTKTTERDTIPPRKVASEMRDATSLWFHRWRGGSKLQGLLKGDILGICWD